MSRATDHLQPSGKRRPGQQLTKDNAGDSDEEGPNINPGTWGKADQATMARRKVIRARRAGAAAEPAPAAEGPGSEQAAGSNPFAGVSLGSAANPFAGVSIVAPAKPPEAETEAAPSAAASADADEGAAKQAAAHQQPAQDSKAAGEQPAAAATAQEHKTPVSGGEDGKVDQAAAAAAAPESKESADNKQATDSTAAAVVDKAGEAADKSAEADKKDPAAPSTGTGLFGGAAAGFGGFGSFGAAGGFGGSGFGGFAAAAKDGTTSGSLFGSYTAPQPGGMFAPVPAFATSRQSKDGDDDGGDDAGGGEGTEVFGGDNTQPVVQLSEVPKQTGEEDEETVYAADGALFEFVNGKEWRERGKGELKVNINTATKQARLVMRQRGSQKLLLNARLYPNMTTSKMVGGKGVTFAAVNAAVATTAGDAAGPEGKDGAEAAAEQPEAGKDKAAGAAHVMRTYALKVKAADKIDEFIRVVDSHKAGPSNVAANTGGGSLMGS